MANKVVLDELKTIHENLYDRALSEGPELRRALRVATNTDAAEGLLGEVNDLLENLRKLSSRVSSFEDYRWLSHAVIKWQNVFSFLDLPTLVRLDPPSDGLLPPEATPPALSEQELDYWIQTHACFFAYTRIANTRRLSTGEEMDCDRRLAYVFLASDILDGKINLAKRIAPNSYEHLEWVWMEDLKHVRAYLLWLERGGGFGEEQSAKNYFDVCDHLRYMLTNPGIKAPASAFEPVRRYIQERYLTGDRIQVERSEYARWLVGHKAFHLYEATGRTDSPANWSQAETYVKTFYENIVPAVVRGDPGSTLAVLRALQCDPADPSAPCQIINTFEVALVTYFVSPEMIEKVWVE